MFSNDHIKQKMLKLSLCLIRVGGMAPHILSPCTSSCPTSVTPREKESCIQWIVDPRARLDIGKEKNPMPLPIIKPGFFSLLKL
jgi:hypothetical protein